VGMWRRTSIGARAAGGRPRGRLFLPKRTGADGSYLGIITNPIQATSYGIYPIEVISRPHYC
jgi:hypothetical protein